MFLGNIGAIRRKYDIIPCFSVHFAQINDEKMMFFGKKYKKFSKIKQKRVALLKDSC